MMKKKYLLPILFCLLSLLSAMGRSESYENAEWSLVEEGDKVILSGIVRRVGNEPFTSLVVTDNDNRDWHLDDEASIILKHLEQTDVTIKAEVILKRMVLADGKEGEAQRILTNLTLSKGNGDRDWD